ncbi:hypothetical protein EV182_003764 [Spiromyces aspiralis]|uniref:Uncharacterized protein n=1 Tax=Spiromyces aspiralis TaxID=68401 RepID=A0ACC1HJV5_9FUNG|nr:hypothetical protein EV182_003764 [Spiromyces aspiralis]
MVYPSSEQHPLFFDTAKKLILVQLIMFGTTSIPPKYSSSAAHKILLQENKEYQTLKSYYSYLDAANILSYVSEHDEIFLQDGNMYLVNKALEAFPRHEVAKIATVYVRLPISRLAGMIHFLALRNKVWSTVEEATLNLIHDMIKRDQIDARVEDVIKDGPTGRFKEKVVVFEPNKKSYGDAHCSRPVHADIIKRESQNMQRLKTYISSITKLQGELQALDQELRRCNAFTSKVCHGDPELRRVPLL